MSGRYFVILIGKINKIKNITSDGIEGRYHHHSGRIDQDENESQSHTKLYLIHYPADAE